MLVSAFVPNHNDAPGLAVMLRRLLAQTLPPAEIVVLDDASTDRSADVVAAAQADAPGRVRLVRYPAKEPDWVGELYRRALAEGAGDYYHLVSANDTVAEDFYAAAATHEGAGVILSDLRVCHPGGDAWDYRYALPPGRTGAGPELLHWCRTTLPSGVTALVSRAALAWLCAIGIWRVGPWNDSLGLALAAWRFGVARVPRVLGAYHLDPQSYGGSASQTPERRRRHWDGMRAVCDDVRSLGGVPAELLDALAEKVREQLPAAA